eukprot:TRINITY_DN5703_c0_g1_i1.p1 TRINITY_DN5703_c0_g1~~TRINITY_DN5703_c0_g1_i1.p1  ORF type:complete len:854 (+),score=152.64 TRINITY_DN5703_c0_g1_i1:46-2607(+)
MYPCTSPGLLLAPGRPSPGSREGSSSAGGQFLSSAQGSAVLTAGASSRTGSKGASRPASGGPCQRRSGVGGGLAGYGTYSASGGSSSSRSTGNGSALKASGCSGGLSSRGRSPALPASDAQMPARLQAPRQNQKVVPLGSSASAGKAASARANGNGLSMSMNRADGYSSSWSHHRSGSASGASKPPSSPGTRNRQEKMAEADRPVMQFPRPQQRQQMQQLQVQKTQMRIPPKTRRTASTTAVSSLSSSQGPSSRHAGASLPNDRQAAGDEAGDHCPLAAAAVAAAAMSEAAAVAAVETLQERGGEILEEGNLAIHTPQSMTGMLPQPENRVLAYWQEALRNPALAATRRPDRNWYFEKRRVQNHLRRLLEELQERLGLDSREAVATDLDQVFKYLVAQAKALGCLDANGEIPDRHLSIVLETLSLWPPELSPTDRSEVTAALHVPSVQAANNIVTGRQQFRTSVSAQDFREGLVKVPFNLPDFPVPAHLLSWTMQRPFVQEHRQAAAEAVATCFSLSRTGLEPVKDFFLTGLISLEEIQRALLRLVPLALVEEAVTRIIRRAAPFFTSEEWHDLVIVPLEACRDVTYPYEQVGIGASPVIDQAVKPAAYSSETKPTTTANDEALPEAAPVSLSSPKVQQRVLRPGPGASRADDATPGPDGTPPGVAPGFAVGEPTSSPWQPLRFRNRCEPVTEPLPCREIREEPVQFMTSDQLSSVVYDDYASGMSFSRVVDWTTASLPSGTARPRIQPAASEGCQTERNAGRTPHQADVGAGARLSWGTSCFKKELADSLRYVNVEDVPTEGSSMGPCGGADPVSLINLQIHNECGGPYLAFAFARCCELYERRRLQESKAQ